MTQTSENEKEVLRPVHYWGITFMYLKYYSPEMTPLAVRLQGEKTKVKYDPQDLSCVQVWDSFEERYINASALDQEYTRGLSLSEHKRKRSKRKRSKPQRARRQTKWPNFWRAKYPLDYVEMDCIEL